MVIFIPTICRIAQRLGLTNRKIQHLVLSQPDAQRAVFVYEQMKTMLLSWNGLDEMGVDHRDGLQRMGPSIRGCAPMSQKLTG